MQALNVESARTLYSFLSVASARYRSRFCIGRVPVRPPCLQMTNEKCQMTNGKSPLLVYLRYGLQQGTESRLDSYFWLPA
jgi:hypothetical protein